VFCVFQEQCRQLFREKQKSFCGFLARVSLLTTMNAILLMTHVLLGVTCILATVWVFVDTLQASEANLGRIRFLTRLIPVVMVLCLLVGGYWYVTFYPADKAIILKGPWNFAHDFFMETKEHLVLSMLLLTAYLPIVASENPAANRDARRLTLLVAAMIVLTGLVLEGEGGVISMGVKAGLLSR